MNSTNKYIQPLYPQYKPNLTVDIKQQVQQTKDNLIKYANNRSPPRFAAVAAEVHGIGSLASPKKLKETSEEDRRIALAKAKFHLEWQLKQNRNDNKVIIPKDGPTLKLLYAPHEYFNILYINPIEKSLN